MTIASPATARRSIAGDVRAITASARGPGADAAQRSAST